MEEKTKKGDVIWTIINNMFAFIENMSDNTFLNIHNTQPENKELFYYVAATYMLNNYSHFSDDYQFFIKHTY